MKQTEHFNTLEQSKRDLLNTVSRRIQVLDNLVKESQHQIQSVMSTSRVLSPSNHAL